ncbi:hypothetical protein [Solirubrum puertoriconensis]|uniref:Uncharacterized protein n=1 Tax=Solirubrum puertoriconensis TaxID=1751427 RepID=A0A9X0L6J3_SOLP1|nr:hypothetical protein [Solirubrum puertoriconensis]KUG09832.1 hypothetical protein ASU33_19375 [Solirubrum puertoriconensis]
MAAKSQHPQYNEKDDHQAREEREEQQKRDSQDRPTPAQENNNTEGSTTAMLNRETHGQIMSRSTPDRIYSDGSDDTETPRPPTFTDDTTGFDPTNRTR